MFAKKLRYLISFFLFSLAEKLAHDRLMAGSSEARPKVIKIPILIEAAAAAAADNNNTAAGQNTSCQNWPAGGQLPAVRPSQEPSICSSLTSAEEVGGRHVAVVTSSSSSRIIPILLSDGSCANSAAMPSKLLASDVDAGGSRTGGQRSAGSVGPSEAGGLGRLRARLAGGRANSVEEPLSQGAAIGPGAVRGPPGAARSAGEMTENLVKTTSTSASDIRYQIIL